MTFPTFIISEVTFNLNVNNKYAVTYLIGDDFNIYKTMTTHKKISVVKIIYIHVYCVE